MRSIIIVVQLVFLYQWHIAPILASSYNVVGSVVTGFNFTFNIRAGLKWSDGVPFTAADVLYTYQVLMNPVIDNSQPFYATYFKDNSSTTMGLVNSTAVYFHALPNSLPANATYDVIELFTIGIFPEHVFAPLIPTAAAWQADITNTGTGPNRTISVNGITYQINGPIGTGPYEYARYDSTNNIWSIVINPIFNNNNAVIEGLKPGTIQTLKFTVISDANTALLSLNTAAVQFVDYNTGLTSVFSQLTASTVAHPVSVMGNSYQELGYNQFSPIWGMNPVNPDNFYYPNGIVTNTRTQIGWWLPGGTKTIADTARTGNTTWIGQEQLAAAGVQTGNITASQWFFDNLNNQDRLDIRLAMDYAIPRQQILKAILNGFGNDNLATWVTPYFSVYNASFMARQYNTTMASELLSKVFGYTYNASATNDTGTPYFTINFLIPNNNPSRILWSSNIAASFISLGINVNSREVSFSTVLNTAIYNTAQLGADNFYNGWDAVFIGGTFISPVPDFRTSVQPQYYQTAGNYYLINNTQATKYSNKMILDTGTNAASNATAFQQWCYTNIPSSIIEEEQDIFGVANQLQNVKPTIYQQFNYNEWIFGSGNGSTTTTQSPPPPITTTAPLTTTPSFDVIEALFGFIIGGICISIRSKRKSTR